MKRASIFKRDIPVGSRKPTASPGIAQEVQGGVGDVFAVKDGDLFAWTYRGDPHYRLRPAGTGPAVLSEVLARRFPSRLLAARYEVVDLVGRSEELENLRDWAWKPAGTAVRVVYGMGGQGKTRLVARFAHDLSQVGWAVVEAHNRLAPLLGGATTAVDTAQSLDGAGLLIIVDYADRWPTPDLLAILDAHIGLPGPVRVLLVGRGLQGWWKSVEGALLDAGIDEVDEFRLSPLSDGLDREGLDVQRAFRSAVAAFSPYLGLTESSLVSVPDYAPTPGSGDALTLYMAALVVADATARGSEPPLNPAALSTYLLDREREGWWQLANSGKITSSPQQIGHVSVVAALTQALPYSAGIQAVQVAGIATSAPEADQLLLDHKITYPTTRPEMVLEALTPDRLAEDYIALTVPGAGPESDFSDPWTISALSHLLTPTQAWRDGSPALPIYIRPAVTGLVEAASRWPHLLTQIIRPLLNRNPGLVLVGGGATVARLATLAGTDANLLKLIDGQLPPRANLEFDEAAVVVAERRIALASNANTSTAEHATLLATVAYRYHNAGRRREALAPAQEAVDIYRVLADPESGNPAVYLPHLAGSLNNLGLLLAELGGGGEALAPAQEAVDIYRVLAGSESGNPAVYLPDVAGSLNNLGLLLAQLGRSMEALAPAQEAVDTYRVLADPQSGNPAAYLPHLATSLNNLGILLAQLGRVREALAPAQEAVDTCRVLADPESGNPASYLPHLAGSLNNLGSRLAKLGRSEEALAPAQEAVDIYRVLADPGSGNPAAYLPHLAGSLNNLGSRLAELGTGEEALAPAQEAVDIYRVLADPESGNPAASLPHLAGSLNNLGALLAELGRSEEVPEPAQEAVDIYRVLADPESGNPAAYLPHLAASLNNLGSRLGQLGTGEEALAPAQEAVDTYRVLADPESGNPAAYLPHLAASLNNLGNRLGQLGRSKEALAPAQEAVDTYRVLADPESGNPAAYLPSLAGSLWTVAQICDGVHIEVEVGLSAVQESLEIFEALAATGHGVSSQSLASVRATKEAMLRGETSRGSGN